MYTDSALSTFIDKAEWHDFPPDFEEEYSDRFHEIPDELLAWYERAREDFFEAESAILERIKE